MSLYGELALADDVEIFAVADLAPELRAAIPHEPGDFALSRTRSRDPSRVVNRDARDLLLEFKTPTRVVDAVIRFANERSADPSETLEGAYELIARLYRANVLVSPATRKDETAERLGSPGMAIFGVTLGPCVHDVEDTEVFFARDESGRATAVKIVRGGVARVEREARAMRRAGGRVPAVYGVHEWNGHGVLLSEWVVGEEVTTAAAALRGEHGAKSEAGLLSLCHEMVDALGELHLRGVLHGDIHPRNLLVEKSGRLRIIDLGLASEPTESAATHTPRGGVAFYMEPELALANLRGESVPPTEAGEQYAIAALVYLLWTGVHYVDWSLERQAMLDQIARCAPVSFADRRVAPFPELEAVLRRALAKAPAERFASCAHLAEALRARMPDARRRDEAAQRRPPPRHEASHAATASFFERCGLGGEALRDGPRHPPFASVNYGGAGIAYALYKLAVARDDARLLATADVWAQKTGVLAAGREAFHTTEIAINENTVGNASLFHSACGVHAVSALVALAFSEATAASRAVHDFVTASRVATEHLDVALGKAGLLLGCAELLEAMPGAGRCDPASLVARGTELRDEIRRALDAHAIPTTVSASNLGLAHGWAGLLFALLRWSQAHGESAQWMRAKLDELASLHEPHGLGIRWPIHNRSIARSGYMDGWCNGAAGHALLWALAHEELGVGEYATYAERAAWSAWSSDIQVGSLCCGLAGIGYACAAAHRVTGDSAWIARAKRAAERACEDRSPWFYPDSLYKGAVGAVLLRGELEAGSAATPFLESALP